MPEPDPSLDPVFKIPMQILPPRPLTPEQRARLFDPAANMRMALAYVKARYSKPWATWSRWYVKPDWDWPGYDCDGMGV